jgi:Transmembrane adaptor Erv26
MWILPLIGYTGVVVGFAFLTLAIGTLALQPPPPMTQANCLVSAASGLYYLSEIVEEHTVIARRVLSRLIYGVIIAQILLWLFDSFPFSLSLLTVVSHLIYASNLRKFPVVKLSDPLFIVSCLLVCLNHWVWFRHFSRPPAPYSSSSSRDATAWRRPYQPDYANMPTFTEVASYFGLCVWLVPFALFVSLSAGDNVLPSIGSEFASSSSALPEGGAKNKNVGLAKALVDNIRDWASETGEIMGFYQGERTRRF